MKRKFQGVLPALIPLIIIFTISFGAFVGTTLTKAPFFNTTLAQSDHEHDDLSFTDWASSNALPSVEGDYRLTSDVTISSTWNVPTGTTNLCLNGHGIRTTSGRVVNIGGGVTLNVYDCGDTVHRFTVSDKKANGAGLAVVNDGATENYETFIGGYITGGVAGDGGGIMVSGTFNLYGGAIIGNSASVGDGNGGGVKVNGGGASFNMYGGSVQYNFGRTGGGLFVEGNSQFTLEGGVISHNVNAIRGSAFFTRGDVRIRGGEIRDHYNVGETVFALWGGTFEITGGVIKDNLNNGDGRSLVTLSSIMLGGDPVIKDNLDIGGKQANLFVNNGGSITMVGAFDDTVKSNKIGVTLQNGKGQFTSGWSEFMDIDADPADYFFSQNEDYEILRVRGEARLVKEPYTLIGFSAGEASGKMEKDILEDGATSFTLPLRSDFTALPGRTLSGWKLGDDVFSPGETVVLGDEDVTFTALWTDGVTIDFNTKGGNEISSQCIIPNTAAEKPLDPKKSGYTFLYWTKDGEEYDFSAPVNENVTLVALWAQGVSVGESFENGMPDGWTYGGDYQWRVDTGDSAGGNAHSGEKNAIAQKDGYDGEAWLVMPETDLSDRNSASLSLWYENREWEGDVDAFGIYYRVDGGDWQQIFYTDSAHDWTHWSGNLPEGAFKANVQIGFKAKSNWGYGVGLDDIEFVSSTPHSHEWNYTASGNVITAVCSGEADGTCLLKAQTLTISAEDKEYDDQPVTATVTKSDNWDAYGLIGTYEIVYSGNTEAGTYTASVTVGSVTASTEFTIVFTGQLHDDIAFRAWNDSASLPDTAGSYYLTSDVTISSRWDVPIGTTNLCLNGHSITRTNASGTTGSVIQVGSGATLDLYDCGTETRYYTIADPSPNGAGLGTIVDESAYNAADENARGSFVGGYITGGVITGEQDANHLIGGGVNVAGGSFTMYGGTIIGNWVCINGGGVKVKGAGASFVMNGGAILANYNQCYGGGISVGDNSGSRLCTLIINGGTIARNQSGRNGGAIHLDEYAHTFVITGGTIVNNYTEGNYESLGRSGGGVIMSGPTLHLSGDPIIKDNAQGNGIFNNVYIRTSSQIQDLSDGLEPGAEIGVYTKELGASNDVKIAVGAKKEDISYLRFDIPDEGCVVFCDGEKDWIYLNGAIVELVGAHHTHESGSVWATVNPVATVTVGETSSYYGDFNSALSAWTDGSTLKLMADVTGQITMSGGNKTFDLNDHSVTYTGGSVIIVSGGTLKIVDESSVKTKHYYTPNQSGVAMISATATDYYFEGGYITGGVATEARGGGLRVLGTGSVVFGGGTLFANSAGWGGGLWSSGNSFITIEGTAAIIGNYSSGNYTSGGGIFMEESSAVTMTGGSIRHNSAQWSGGGVRDCVNENTGARFTMTGGEITGNYANNNQGNGFCFDIATTFNIGGTARIIGNQGTNDVFMYNDRYLTIVSPFEEGALIGVTLQSGTGTFTSGWSTYMGENDPADYFTSEDDSFIVRLVDGEAAIMPPHTHSWSYTADGNVITATCVGEGDCDLTSQTLTITAVGKTYDGTAVVASVEKSENWTAYGLTEPPEIVYSGNADAGTYTASVTVGEATASVQFVIDPATLTVTAAAKVKNYGESDPELTYTVNGLVGDDTLTGALTREAGENVGSYAITQGTLIASGNYTIDFTGANLTVSPIDVTVTITGNHFAADYDGEEHSVSGYTATASSALYDVDKDFTFGGTAIARQTNAGTAVMGLAASRFTNTNDNFATVTFIVTDGYITVETVDAVILIAPADKKPIYNGSEQSLVSEGSTDGGIIYYSLGKDSENAPDDESFTSAVPSAKEAGYYFVWYKVKADGNHNDLAPVCIKVSLSESDWVILSGVIYGSDGVTAIEGVSVTLVEGNRDIDYVKTDENGRYTFTVPTGMYSIVADNGGNVETSSVALFEDKEQDIVTSLGKTESRLVIDTGDDDNIGIAVSGLNEEARSARNDAPGADSVSVTMTVEIKTEETAVNAAPIVSVAGNKSLDFYEIKVEKTVDSIRSELEKTANVLEIAIPCANAGKRGLTVYSYHGTIVREFVPSDTKANGTFRVDIENKLVYIYTNSFSTYAIGYTPYYNLGGSITLGSFKGTATVTIKSDDGETVFTYENVAMGEINFEDIPMGRYVMTITWTDGVKNTLFVPLNIGEKYGEQVIPAPSEENSSTAEPNLAGETETAFEKETVPVKKTSGCYVSGVTTYTVATSPIGNDEDETSEHYPEQTAIVTNEKDGRKNEFALPETVAC